MKKVLVVFLLFVWADVFAHDFVVTIDNQKVYFNITSNKNKTAEVTFNGKVSDKTPTYFEGELVVPDKVRHNDVVYSITGIGPKAFCGADKLTGVELPTGITYIGDFAFEGCSSLNRIIFPSNNVEFGQGVFFKCDKIQNVSFGSDWESVDLEMFRWSDCITSILIPVKMEKIQNIKSLKKLERISVDANNSKFATDNGVLYSKDYATLYSCPRAWKGEITINKDTKTIMRGAFRDCNSISVVDIPEGIESLSYSEFYRMTALSKIIFRKLVPVSTALSKGVAVFLLEVYNPNVVICVKKEAKENYKTLVQETGKFSDMDGKNVDVVYQENMPKVKNIKKVKSFSDYK